jgi:SAM-dependent methyltransferase
MTFACRSCSGVRLAPVIDLGSTPLANALRDTNDLVQDERRYPLRVVFCQDCSLVQITETVSPETLFSNYLYFSSFSDTAITSARELAARLTAARNLDGNALVMEVASNDGYLLQHYRNLGVPVLGIEPAANIARVAEANGVPTRCAFFGREEAERIVADGLRCDVLHANNVLAHVPDLNGFAAGVKLVLKDDGVASVEVPYLGDLLEKLEFDTIYHEHLCYFSATALDRLFAYNGLLLADLEHIEMHGGSLRLMVTHAGGARAATVDAVIAEEERLGMTQPEFYAGFSEHVSSLRGELLALLTRLRAEGKSLAAYGASAKGSTLLNYFGIGRDLLDFVVDRSTAKQGKFTPGMHLPILPPAALLEHRPDYLLLLTWNFADEILAQQASYRDAGGKVIIPIPQVRVV